MENYLKGMPVSNQILNRVPSKGKVRRGFQEDYIAYKNSRNKTVE